MSAFGIINRDKTAFVLIDIQEKFVPAISAIKEVISNAEILMQSAIILNIPVIVTEQYPKGLGKTVNNIKLPAGTPVIEKLHFSCFGNNEFRNKINELGVESVVLFGIEAHVCLLKTALDAIQLNLGVHVVADAVSSRTPANKSIALERMRQSGAFIVSTEMILFQLMEYSGTDEFKAISKLIK
ncbi:MAG: hydrolase [Spirochaetes bacterium]|nr:hydrolase [Spirochaetota bacterium]